MSFQPPRCPNLACIKHRTPDAWRIAKWGYYTTACRGIREQRYRCLECGKTFCRQTYRHDYYDKRPDTNARLFELLTSGVGLRQSAYLLGINQASAQLKMRKMSATCRGLHDNLSPELPASKTYVLDEEESYEQASIRPLTVPLLIEQKSYFVVASAVGTIRRMAPAGTARRRRQERDEELRGRRPDQSRRCVKEVMLDLRRRTTGPIALLTDEKSSYATLAREVFGVDVTHETTAGRAPRTLHNPLFPVNLLIAMSRDNCGRLRRRSWLVSKLARWLRGQLWIFTVFRNYVRPRTRRSPKEHTPAYLLGLLPRQLAAQEALRWRQDWGDLSIHPMNLRGTRTVGGGQM